MILYLILIGREQNNCRKFKNLKLIKIFLIAHKKEELKNRLIKRNQNTLQEIEKDLILLMRILNIGLIMIMLLLMKT